MSGNCGVCSADIVAGDLIKCAGACENVYHYSCVTKKWPDSIKTRGTKKDWFCEVCRASKNTSRGSSRCEEAPAAVTKEFMTSIMESLKKEVFAELKNHSYQFHEFKTSLEFYSSKLDETNKTMEELKAQNKEIIRENETYKQNNLKLTQKVNELEVRVRDMEQYSRRNNLEISGVPKTPGENEMDILRDVGRAIGVEVTASSVVAVHRVPTYNRARIPPIVAKFTTRDQRDALIQGYRQRKTLMASDVNKGLPASRIYIGEHLTPANKIILKKLKDTGKELNIKFVWCREGKFFARRAEGERSVRIADVNELRNIKW